jgi:hypothetical protein
MTCQYEANYGLKVRVLLHFNHSDRQLRCRRERAAVFREMRLPDQPCTECGTDMECGELAERYLLFLELS